jgi:DNA gyrase subunit B
MDFARGKPLHSLKEVGPSDKRGTRVEFTPDDTIFTVTVFDYDILLKRLRELAFLNRGIKINYRDERDSSHPDVTFCYAGGLSSFVGYLNENKTALFPKPIYFSGEKEGHDGPVEFEVALQWNDGYAETFYSYVNNIATRQGGTHVSGFSTALTRVLNNYIKNHQLLKNDKISIAGDDMREGLCAVIACKVPNPQVEGQTKQRVIAMSTTRLRSKSLAKSSPSSTTRTVIARIIGKKAIVAAQARSSLQGANSRAKQLWIVLAPRKATDCQKKIPPCVKSLCRRRLSGRVSKSGRDRRYQAMAVRGKILNVEKARLQKILQNQEVGAMVAAFGCGIGHDNFHLEKLRYHKIIIMTDADVDGSHIRTLLLTFLYRHLPALIENSFVYVARPPLYR